LGNTSRARTRITSVAPGQRSEQRIVGVDARGPVQPQALLAFERDEQQADSAVARKSMSMPTMNARSSSSIASRRVTLSSRSASRARVERVLEPALAFVVEAGHAQSSGS
jgi:hypothetical protein